MNLLKSIIFVSILLCAPLGVSAATYTVDSVDDTTDFLAGDGFCDTDDGVGDGPCTLRAAMEEANFDAGADTIEFTYTGEMYITPLANLPTIASEIYFDATSHPEYAGVPKVVVDGSNVSGANAGTFYFSGNGDNSTIQGFSLVNAAVVDIFSDNLGGNTDNVTIIGNYIGFLPNGTEATLPVWNSHAIRLGGSSDWVIGGIGTENRNYITTNSAFGAAISIAYDSNGNEIYNNYIGIAPDGTTYAGDGSIVISLSNNNIIGGLAEGEPNYMQGWNRINGGTGNLFSRNTINGQLDIVPQWGVRDANDLGDADEGGNNLQNYPVITNTYNSGEDLIVEGNLNSNPSGEYLLIFYANESDDAGGQDYLGHFNVTTDENGNIEFSETLTGSALGTDSYITATASASNGDTSEFALNYEYIAPVNFCLSETRVDPSVDCFGNDYYTDFDDIMVAFEASNAENKTIVIDSGTWTGNSVTINESVSIMGYNDILSSDVVLDVYITISDEDATTPKTVAVSNLTLGTNFATDHDLNTDEKLFTLNFNNIRSELDSYSYCFEADPGLIDSITVTNSNLSCKIVFTGTDFTLSDSTFIQTHNISTFVFTEMERITLTGNTFSMLYPLDIENYFGLLLEGETQELTVTNNTFEKALRIAASEAELDDIISDFEFSGNIVDYTGETNSGDNHVLFNNGHAPLGIEEMVFDDNEFVVDNTEMTPYIQPAYVNSVLSFSNNILPNTFVWFMDETPSDTEKVITGNYMKNLLYQFRDGSTKIEGNHMSGAWYTALTIGEANADSQILNNVFSGSTTLISDQIDLYEGDFIEESNLNIDNNIFLTTNLGGGSMHSIYLNTSPYKHISLSNNYIFNSKLGEDYLGQAYYALACSGGYYLENEFRPNEIDFTGNFIDFLSYNNQSLVNVTFSGEGENVCDSEDSYYKNWLPDQNTLRTLDNSTNIDVTNVFESNYYGTVISYTDDTYTVSPDQPILENLSPRLDGEDLSVYYMYLYNSTNQGVYVPIIANTENSITIQSGALDFETVFFEEGETISFIVTNLMPKENSPLIDSGVINSVATTDIAHNSRPFGQASDVGVFETEYENLNAPIVNNVTVNGSTEPGELTSSTITVDYDYTDAEADSQFARYIYLENNGDIIVLNYANEDTEDTKIFTSSTDAESFNLSDYVLGNGDGDITLFVIACDRTNRCSDPSGGILINYSTSEPEVTNILINGESTPSAMCDLTPTIDWTYFDENSVSQSVYALVILPADYDSMEDDALWVEQIFSSNTIRTLTDFALEYNTSYRVFVGVQNANEQYGQAISGVFATDTEENCNQGEVVYDTYTGSREPVPIELKTDDIVDDERKDIDVEVPKETNDIKVTIETPNEKVADIIENLTQEVTPSANNSLDINLEPKYGETFKSFVDGYTMTLSPSFNDIDRDGCSDRVELQLTKSNLFKFNGLGIGDCDLNYVWGIDQDSMATALQSGEEFISLNLSEDPSQNIFASPEHLIFMGGVFSAAPSNDKVKVEFAITNTESGLSYNLGSESPEFAKLVGSDGYQALFSYLNKFNFPDGTYNLVASANLGKNNSVSATRTFTIDSSVAQTDLNVIDFSGFKFNLFEPDSSLSDIKFDVDSNGNAYVYGQTNFNNKVVAAWNSVLLTSVVMADSSSGKFYVEPRQKLPSGQHKVILFAENLDNTNVKSKPIEIEFTVKSEFEKAFIVVRNIAFAIVLLAVIYLTAKKFRLKKNAPKTVA